MCTCSHCNNSGDTQTDFANRTGTTGSVGSAVANEILKAGFRIHAAVRNRAKAAHLAEVFDRQYGPDAFKATVIADWTSAAVLAEEMKGCAGVVHVASDTSMGFDPNQVITPTVNLAKTLLEAASMTPSIERFVYTSSTATLPSMSEPIHITPSSWAPDSVVETAWSEPYTPANSVAIYSASKISTERACWDFMKERRPGFVLNTVVGMVHLGAFITPRIVSFMNAVVYGVWKGDARMAGFLSGVGANCLINLEDSGLLHVAALTQEDVQGERLLGVGERFNRNDVVNVMAKIEPDRKLPPRLQENPTVLASVDMDRSLELLRRLGKPELTGLEESIRQLVKTGP